MVCILFSTLKGIPSLTYAFFYVSCAALCSSYLREMNTKYAFKHKTENTRKKNTFCSDARAGVRQSPLRSLHNRSLDDEGAFHFSFAIALDHIIMYNVFISDRSQNVAPKKCIW